MRTQIDWPKTYVELSGMDRFCGGPAYEDISADHFYSMAKPIVNRAVLCLEQEIDHLQTEVNRLNELVAKKPKVKYRADIGAWVIVDNSGDPK